MTNTYIKLIPSVRKDAFTGKDSYTGIVTVFDKGKRLWTETSSKSYPTMGEALEDAKRLRTEYMGKNNLKEDQL